MQDVTGRKIIVDTYGGMGRHGGGAFSGKDPTKVDRSAAYAARWAAKNVVAAGLGAALRDPGGLCNRCGAPIERNVETFGTGAVPDEEIARLISRIFRPASRCDHPRSGSAQADLPPDCRLRALWTR